MYRLGSHLGKITVRAVTADLLWTFVGQAIVLVCSLFTYRLAASLFGAEGFGEYVLARRVPPLLEPIVVLGMGIALVRYIAVAGESSDPLRSDRALVSASTVVVVCTTTLLLILNIFPGFLSAMFLGDAKYAVFMLPLSVILLATAFHKLSISYFRGNMEMLTFNGLHVANIGLAPLLALVVTRILNASVHTSLMLTGVFPAVVILVVAGILFRRFPRDVFSISGIRNSMGALLRYGVPRVPGDLAVMGMFSLPPIVAAHVVSVGEVGYLIIGLNVLRMVGAIMLPLPLVLLPRVSHLVGQDKQQRLTNSVTVLVNAVLQVAAFVMIQLIVFADVILRFWLGPEFVRAAPVFRVSILALVPYVFFVAVRAVLDGLEVKALNTRNAFIALGIFIIVVGLVQVMPTVVPSPVVLAAAVVLGFACLGVATFATLKGLLCQSSWLNDMEIAIAISVGLGLASILLRPLVSSIVALAILEVTLGFICLSLLWLLKVAWIRNIYDLMFRLDSGTSSSPWSSEQNP